MKKSQFTPNQIAGILKEFDNGKAAEELSRDHGVSKATLYKMASAIWRHGGQ